MTLAGTCTLDAPGAGTASAVAPPAAPAAPRAAQAAETGGGGARVESVGMAAASPAAAAGGCGRAAGGTDAPAPPRIRSATKMTHRIQNLYGDAEADRRILCMHCSRRIAIGSRMRRVKRTGRCWHEECYGRAGHGGRLPPKIRARTTMTRRIKKLFGGGDDHSVLCQMCRVEIGIGTAMRRPIGSRMCWHDTCYRMTWGGCGKARAAPAPSRDAYIVSNVKWKKMLSNCLKCVGSRLCDHHGHVEKMYRVPKKPRGASNTVRFGSGAVVAVAGGAAPIPSTAVPAATPHQQQQAHQPPRRRPRRAAIAMAAPVAVAAATATAGTSEGKAA